MAALEFAHSKGVIHRDIKPANIIILADGQVKVSDFGVARLDTSDLTSAGFMVGTPNYMSPEGLRGHKVDNRSDIYSVGLLLLELITKKKPYAGKNNDELLESLIQFTRAADVNLLELQDLVRRSLMEAPVDRFQSAAEFSVALESLLNTQGPLLATLETQIRPVASDDPTLITPSQEAAVSPEHQPNQTSASSSNWHPDLLKVIESSLTKFIGPMASFLVRKNSKTVFNVSDLSNTLAEHIPSDQDREAFLQQLASTGIYEKSADQSQSSSTQFGQEDSQSKSASQLVFSGDASVSGQAITPELVDKVAKKLTAYIGPLAPRLVKKAAKKAANYVDLKNRVAEQIPNKSERAAFLKSLDD